MRAFIDTSTLFKKYVDEDGAEEFDALLNTIFQIIVSPVTIIEMHSIIYRRLRERSLSAADARWIENEFMTDYDYFGIVQWNEDLTKKSIALSRKYPLRTLDGIQLASSILSNAAIFITSDKRLHAFAVKELDKVTLIG
ncbi:MAG: type II toxin-antitoxin system VapC family toxin [Chitinivibrionales bacterium]|nr:type II toxin-antitoxin system VapC family toxin [Chitinivibrionales bacterium]